MSATYNKDYFDLYEVTTKTDPLILRSKASTSGSVLVLMPKGSFVWGKGVIENNFLKCIYMCGDEDIVGYASLKYLTKVEW